MRRLLESCLEKDPKADRPLHLPFLVDNVHLMQDAEYWQLLGDLWTDCDMVGPNQRAWLTLFKLQRNDRYKLILEDERLKFDALPDEVRLYRSAGLKYARSTNDGHSQEEDRQYCGCGRPGGRNACEVRRESKPSIPLVLDNADDHDA